MFVCSFLPCVFFASTGRGHLWAIRQSSFGYHKWWETTHTQTHTHRPFSKQFHDEVEDVAHHALAMNKSVWWREVWSIDHRCTRNRCVRVSIYCGSVAAMTAAMPLPAYCCHNCCAVPQYGNSPQRKTRTIVVIVHYRVAFTTQQNMANKYSILLLFVVVCVCQCVCVHESTSLRCDTMAAACSNYLPAR